MTQCMARGCAPTSSSTTRPTRNRLSPRWAVEPVDVERNVGAYRAVSGTWLAFTGSS